jgi:pimeloyl-ACP methyl ester carboxylesterase
VTADLAQVLDALGVGRCAVLAWSGGALTGLALAAGLPGRVAGLGVVAGSCPGRPTTTRRCGPPARSAWA